MPGGRTVEYYIADFEKKTKTGRDRARVRWAWSTDGTWVAPDSPRWQFAKNLMGVPVLYKIYIVTPVPEAEGDGRPEDDATTQAFVPAAWAQYRRRVRPGESARRRASPGVPAASDGSDGFFHQGLARCPNLTFRLSAVLANPRPALRTPVPSPRLPPEPRPPAVRPRGPRRVVAEGGRSTWPSRRPCCWRRVPVMLACVLLVRATSRGPAMYTQQRVGRGGRVFTLYKIRTMYHECESLTGPRWCLPGDPRITPVGRVLRKLHLDELPQLWNVLRGDMSLIGPRPERPEICNELRHVVPGYDRRHAVKPGITGFAQVHLPPDSCVRSVKNKLVYDLFYIRRRSARMEAYILVCTGPEDARPQAPLPPPAPPPHGRSRGVRGKDDFTTESQRAQRRRDRTDKDLF